MLYTFTILTLLTLTLSTLLLTRLFLQKKTLRQAARAVSPNGLSAVETLTLGGVRQSILIQAADLTKPVLLVLHGGPAMPFPGVGCRMVDYTACLTTHELMKEYILVFWDQRGIGKSNGPDAQRAPFNREQLVTDCLELIDVLRDRFAQDKIYLAASSWGTLLGIEAAARHPEKLHAYIALSQIVNWAESDKLLCDWALRQAHAQGNRKAIRELTRIGAPPYLDEKTWPILRNWAVKLGGYAYESATVKGPRLSTAFQTMLTSPDYTLRELLRFPKSFLRCYNREMIAEFARIDIPAAVSRLQVPVLFIHGRHDQVVHPQLTEAFYDHLQAPEGKAWVWLDNSAHFYHPDDARLVEKLLLQLPERRLVTSA